MGLQGGGSVTKRPTRPIYHQISFNWLNFERGQPRASAATAATAAPIGLVASVGQEMATALLCRIRHNTRLPVSTI